MKPTDKTAVAKPFNVQPDELAKFKRNSKNEWCTSPKMLDYYRIADRGEA